MTILAMEKMLLERLLLRKDMRLNHLEEKLMEQSLNLKKVEKRLHNYESLSGVRMLKTLGRACGVLSGFDGRIVFRWEYDAGDIQTEDVDEDTKDKTESKTDIDYGLAIIIMLTAVPCWMKMSKYTG